MRKRKDLQGLAIVDVGGTKLGSIDELVISPEDGRILAFTMAHGMLGGSHSYVAIDDVRAIGADAVTVEGENAARRDSEMPDGLRQAHEASRALVGKKVVTENGSLLGTISDYYVDETARRVTGLTVGSGGLLSGEDGVAADRIMSVGPDAVIVTDEDEDRGTHDPERSASRWAARS